MSNRRPIMLPSRRGFLLQNAFGIGSLALAYLLQQDQASAKNGPVPKQPQSFDLKPKPTPLAPRAKAMISLFQHGGPSHMDLTDPKPELSKRDGEEYAGEVGFSFVNEASKRLMGTRWKFAPRGACGTELSELHAPRGANFQRVPINRLLASLTKLNPTSPAYSSPSRLLSSGFGSVKSI